MDSQSIKIGRNCNAWYKMEKREAVSDHKNKNQDKI